MQQKLGMKEHHHGIFDTFFQLSLDLCCVRDRAGYFQQVSDRWSDVLGWSAVELQARPWMEWVHPEDVADTDEQEVRCDEPGRDRPILYKNRWRHQDGSYRWLSWRVSPYRDGLSYGIAQDVTQTQWRGSAQYRTDLQATLNLRDQAIAASSVGIVMVDAQLPDLPLVYVNPAFERMTGYSASEVLGNNCRFLQREYTQQPALDLLRQAIQEQRNCTVVLKNFRKDGTPFWNELTISPIFDAEHNLTHFVGIQIDATVRMQTEQSLRLEKNKSDRLLRNVLPQPIVQQLKQLQGSLAQEFKAATILFADIVNFTPNSAQMDALALVDQLNRVFSSFDRLASQLGVEKIKTIGDAYMAAAGLPLPQTNHVSAIADLALAMQAGIVDFAWPNGHPIELRIGLHTGSVVGGVIGINKFIYDLWGDTVNLAARMEQAGQPGRVHVTATVYEQLRDRYDFEPRGYIKIKGKGEMMTYWLQGRRDD